MKQGRLLLPLALAAALAVAGGPVARVDAAPKKSGEAPAVTTKRKSYAFHQFTGVVTALDKTTLTVEKSGKDTKSLVFTKFTDMKTTGDLQKDARVTVFYREEGGHPVAHKVVVKTATATASR